MSIDRTYPNKIKIINATGKETEYVIPDLKHGETFPKVMITPGKVSELVPSRVYVVDDDEIAKRFWSELVYRETTALYI